MEENHKYISRRNVYKVLMGINIVTAIVRLFLFPNQSIWFHVSIFLATCVVLYIGWEYLLLVHRILNRRMPLEDGQVKRILMQIFLCAVFYSILGQLLFKAAGLVFHQEIPELLDKIAYVLYLFVAMIFNLVFFGSYYFFRWKADLIRAERLQLEQSLVKYDALRNQLNPHFLFNALASLNSLIFENQQLASDYLQQLSRVYRYTLQNKDKQTVSLQTETDFIRHYIFLFKTRFNDAIEFKIEIGEIALEKGVVPVTLQILIENAVKHNVISSAHQLVISIYDEDGFLVVENNIRKKSQVETSNQQGIDNLKALYHYLDPRPVEIVETIERFVVRIPLV